MYHFQFSRDRYQNFIDLVEQYDMIMFCFNIVPCPSNYRNIYIAHWLLSCDTCNCFAPVLPNFFIYLFFYFIIINIIIYCWGFIIFIRPEGSAYGSWKIVLVSCATISLQCMLYPLWFLNWFLWLSLHAFANITEGWCHNWLERIYYSRRS
jgi:hypothetical protein